MNSSLPMSDYISEDAVAQILKYFPVKSLLRSRCVCKGWKQLIDSPTFLHAHLVVQKPSFFVGYKYGEFLAVDPTVLPPLVDTLRCEGMESVFGTSHGVVCLWNWDAELLIWNPSIRKSLTLTLPDDFEWDYSDGYEMCHGFWIDPSTKEYKVIILSFAVVHAVEEGVYRYRLDGVLYSSARDGWSVIPQEKLGEWVSSNECAPVMVGDVGHWVGRHRTFIYEEEEEEDDDHGDKVIMSFDFKEERFAFIEMTDLMYSRVCVPCRWQGKLSLLCCDKEFPHRCDLYSRQEGSSWEKMFGFDLFAPSLHHVIWALEDKEEIDRGVVKEMEGNGRVVAAITHGEQDELVLIDAKIGCIPLKSGLRSSYFPNVASDFVESLLFPP